MKIFQLDISVAKKRVAMVGFWDMHERSSEKKLGLGWNLSYPYLSTNSHMYHPFPTRISHSAVSVFLNSGSFVYG